MLIRRLKRLWTFFCCSFMFWNLVIFLHYLNLVGREDLEKTVISTTPFILTSTASEVDVIKLFSLKKDDDYEHLQLIPECKCFRKYLFPPPRGVPQILNTSCSDEGTFYRSGQNVVSFSLHYSSKMDANSTKKLIESYVERLKSNLNGIKKYYPGLTMRIYNDVKLEGEYCDFVCKNRQVFWCDVRRSPGLGDKSGLYYPAWSFFPLEDPTVDIFLSRNLDSEIIYREASAMVHWLTSPMTFHVMRDATYHNAPILGGLWGARNSLINNDQDDFGLLERLIQEIGTKNWRPGLDSEALTKVIFEKMKDYILAFDSYFCQTWGQYTETRPFPTPRKHDMDVVGNWDSEKNWVEPCPKECRKNESWIFC